MAELFVALSVEFLSELFVIRVVVVVVVVVVVAAVASPLLQPSKNMAAVAARMKPMHKYTPMEAFDANWAFGFQYILHVALSRKHYR